MLFSSIIFIFYFLPLTMFFYFAVPKEKIQIRNGILLFASLIFYSWGEPVYVILMIYSAIFNFFMSKEIEKTKTKGGSAKADLTFTVIINLAILGFFKYFGFLMDTINGITGLKIEYTALALPIGISFYTFQGMSYIFDVYRGNIKSDRHIFSFALYLSLFPQLIAGPIVKYRDVAEQLYERETSIEKIGGGASRFIIGLGKKAILANNFGAIYTAISASSNERATVVTFWIGIFAYTLQIYFDFSGYSDMAIGLGRIFGFEFMENFQTPYMSKSITEFWRRWHISLGTWFREYVYFPLGGNRVSTKKHIINLLVVWALTGLWHGASWNFVMWGTYYGILLIIEKYYLMEKMAKWKKPVQHLYTMLVVIIGWVFFSITDIAKAFKYLGVMFGIGAKNIIDMQSLYLIKTEGILFIFGIWLATSYPKKDFEKLKNKHPQLAGWLLIFIFIISISYLVYGSYNPFLYFRF